MRSIRAAQQKRQFYKQWRKAGSPQGKYIPNLENGGLNSGYTYDRISDVVRNSNNEVSNTDPNAFVLKDFKYIPQPVDTKRRMNRGALFNDASDIGIFVLPEDAEKLKAAWRLKIKDTLYRVQEYKYTSVIQDGTVYLSLTQ